MKTIRYAVVSSLVLCTFLTEANVDAFRETLLHKLACAKIDDLPSNVSYVLGSTRGHCFQLVLLSNLSMAIILDLNTDGSVSCGFLSEVPITTTCNGSEAGGLVYSCENLMPCPVKCDYYYHLLGVRYCAHQSLMAMNYSQSDAYCRSLGGMLAEVETPADLQTLGSHITWSDSVYVGITYSIAANFTWNRGDLVNDSLWAKNSPNNYNGNEFCVKFRKNTDGRVGLRDIPCDLEHPALCALRCYEG